MIKIGDKVVIKNWSEYKPKVVRIYREDPNGKETKWDFETGRIMVQLDWSEYGFEKSKVALHDQDKSWFLYSDAN
jgi:hypothetical protein